MSEVNPLTAEDEMASACAHCLGPMLEDEDTYDGLAGVVHRDCMECCGSVCRHLRQTIHELRKQIDVERVNRIEAGAKVERLEDQLAFSREHSPDATAKRFAEWLRGVGTGSDVAFCNTLAEMVERGDWRNR